MGSVIFFEEPLKWIGVIVMVLGAWFLVLMYIDWLYRIFTRPKENRNVRRQAGEDYDAHREGDRSHGSDEG